MIERVERTPTPSLSFNQDLHLLGEWLAGMRGQRVLPFHPSLVHYLDGRPAAGALEAALNDLVRRHEVLRTAFPVVSALAAAESHDLARRVQQGDVLGPSLFRQRIRDTARIELSWRTVACDSRDPRALAVEVGRVTQQLFAYDAPPLMRAAVLESAQGPLVLVVALHHLVADLWSLGVLRQDLERLYTRALRPELPEPPEPKLHYADFAAWQRRQARDGAFERMIAYWTEQWQEYLPERLTISDLPFARPAPGTPTFETGVEILALEPALGAAVSDLAGRLRVTPYMLWLATAALLFRAYTGKSRVALFGNLANRMQPETQNLVGWVSNSYLFGAQVDPDESLQRLLERVRGIVLRALSYQGLPLGVLWARLLSARQQAQLTVDDWIELDFASAAGTKGRSRIEGLTTGPAPSAVPPSRTTLQIGLAEKPDELTLHCVYSAQRFAADDVRRMLRDAGLILERMVTAPEERVSELVERLGRFGTTR